MHRPISCSFQGKLMIPSFYVSNKKAPHLYLDNLLTRYSKMFLLSAQHSELAGMVFHMTDNAEVSVGIAVGRTKNHDEEGTR